MNNILVGEFENKKICTISWPFVRYEALIPEQIKGDLFVWLYLSLFTYRNEQNNLAKNTYTLSVKEEVKKILADKFGKIIDAQTMEKIINNAEKDYVVTEDEKSYLKAEVFGFLETYEELFSDKLQMKFIFQDGLTGEVVPDFSETFSLPEVNGKVEESFELRKDLKKPSKRAIQKAYKNYLLIKKGQEVVEDALSDEQDENSPFDEFDDEDRQEFFDTLEDDDLFECEDKPKKHNADLNNKNYAIRYYDAARVEYNLKVDLYVVKNQIYAWSPFGGETDQWFDRCIKIARNINEKLDSFFKTLEDQFTVKTSEQEIQKFFGYKDTISDSLKHCGPLYRLVSSIDNIEMKKTVLEMDSLYDSKSKYFFGEVGKFLEYLVEPFKRHNANERKLVTKETFISEIECKCSPKGIDYHRLTYSEVYKNWLDGWDHFKADTADMVISTKLVNSSLIYSSFINDMFELYDLRNINGHKKKKDDSRNDIKPSQDHLDKLLKVTKVIADIL